MMPEKDFFEADFSGFGYRELGMARDLLDAYLKTTGDLHIEGLKIGFNANSAAVFLEDEDYRTWMMNGDKLEEWFNCGICGAEGFFDDVKDLASHSSEYTQECKDWIEGMRKE